MRFLAAVNSLADPHEWQRVYDPCSGSGGMLNLSAEHVREHGGNPRSLGLYGQEDNDGVWSIIEDEYDPARNSRCRYA